MRPTYGENVANIKYPHKHSMQHAAACLLPKLLLRDSEQVLLRARVGSTTHLRTLKASHLRTLQTSHLRTAKPRHPRTKSAHPRTLLLGTSHFQQDKPLSFMFHWGGVGWVGGWGGWGGVGWGGMITFMFLCTHRHSNLIIFLPVEQRQAQLCHDQLPLGGWVGGVGGVGGVG